jgi:Spy/CpxP family protein refolding chaperone
MKKPLTLALLGILGVGGVALAQRPEAAQPGPPHGRSHMSMMKQELGLTDEQVGQLRKLHSDQRRAAIRRRADLRIARMDLDELLNAATVDEKALGTKMKEIGDLQAAALKARVDSRLALRKVLTPEQLQKMKELRPAARRGERGFRGRQGRPPMPPPGPGGFGPGDEPEDEPEAEPDEVS